MTIGERREQKSALSKWLESSHWQAFGTLKFTDGESIGEHKADAIVKKFFNALDRAYLGSNLVGSGHRLERVVFKQFGQSGSNIHFHFVANSPCCVEHFCETARCLWDEVSQFTMGYENTVIER